jgi:hypothetical protein
LWNWYRFLKDDADGIGVTQWLKSAIGENADQNQFDQPQPRIFVGCMLFPILA